MRRKRNARNCRKLAQPRLLLRANHPARLRRRQDTRRKRPRSVLQALPSRGRPWRKRTKARRRNRVRLRQKKLQVRRLRRLTKLRHASLRRTLQRKSVRQSHLRLPLRRKRPRRNRTKNQREVRHRNRQLCRLQAPHRSLPLRARFQCLRMNRRHRSPSRNPARRSRVLSRHRLLLRADLVFGRGNGADLLLSTAI